METVVASESLIQKIIYHEFSNVAGTENYLMTAWSRRLYWWIF